MSAPREVCLLLDGAGLVLWSDASSDPFALPDSRARWEAIWAHRERLDLVAHSHPLGPLAFSDEDLSTMAALTQALGRRLAFAVVAPEATLLSRLEGEAALLTPEPPWADALRLASGMAPRQANASGHVELP